MEKKESGICGDDLIATVAVATKVDGSDEEEVGGEKEIGSSNTDFTGSEMTIGPNRFALTLPTHATPSAVRSPKIAPAIVPAAEKYAPV